MDLPVSKTIGIKDAGYDESWLQDMIWENPSILGLGDLETEAEYQVEKELQISIQYIACFMRKQLNIICYLQ